MTRSESPEALMSTGPAGGLEFDSLPVADQEVLRRRLLPRPTRRGLFKAAAYGSIGASLGAFTVINLAAGRAEAAYFSDYTDHTSGPCRPGGYASGHTEAGLKCGPSTMCTDLSCCWKYRSAAGNRVGWHKNGPGTAGYFLHRPDACWSGTYDSWRWKFSDGTVYRCSDGWTCSPSGSCYKSICPWPV